MRYDLPAHGARRRCPLALRTAGRALKYGAYTEDADGTIRGLVYAPFAEYVSEVYGREATVHRHLEVDGIPALLDAGRTVPASVHYGIRHPERPAPARGGHPVLVTGRAADGSGLHFHNPSGTDAGTRAAELPVAELERFFAGGASRWRDPPALGTKTSGNGSGPGGVAGLRALSVPPIGHAGTFKGPGQS